MLHLCWKLFSSNAQWAELCRARFLNYGSPTTTYLRSSIWHGIKQHVHTVRDNSKWIIGTGTQISFWLDTWLDHSIAAIFDFPASMFPHLIAKVSSFIDDNREWKLPNRIVQHDASVTAQIYNIIIPKQLLEDRLVWCTSNDGYLSAKQAYLHLYPEQQTASWVPWIWHKVVPPSSSFVVWRCFYNKMPTDENLTKRGCTVVSGCVLCLSGSETTQHLFLHCSFATQLWLWLGSRLNIAFDCSSVSTVFESFDPSWSSFLTNMVNAAVIHVFHSIWMARNGIRFNNAKIFVQAAQTKVLTAIALSANLASGSSFTTEITMLQGLKLAPRPCQPATDIIVVWKTPIIAWIKANTDGSVAGLSAACGGLFRDYLANYKGGFAQKLGTASVLHTELMALILSMEFAYKKGWNYLWVESDSKVALQAFVDISIVPWTLRNLWSNCLSLGLTLRWSHIYREGNTCADKMASLGHSFEQVIDVVTT